MNSKSKYPLLLSSVPKEIIWGGTRLSEKYNKTATFSKIAESWELTVRNDGTSIITNGEYSGISLRDYLKNNPYALGSNCNNYEFPLLIKFIDAEDDLSIQVHPDDSYASVNENDSGKTEMWYIAEADENASLIYGLKEQISREEMKVLLENGNADYILNKIKIRRGEVYFIPAGHVHAICKGALIAEIQQNSNITYRMYDYNRIGSDGKKRELHVNKALDVIKHRSLDEIVQIRFSGNKNRHTLFDGLDLLCDCEYFRVSKAEVSNSLHFDVDSTSFASLLFLDSIKATVSCCGVTVQVNRGDSIFIPADSGRITVTGQCELLLSEV